MNHIMIDIETMGTRFNAPVVALAGVYFDPYTGETGAEFYEAISLETSARAGAKCDMSTVIWWMKQSDEARAAITGETLPLGEALRRFIQFCGDVQPGELQVWGNGASFDLVILRSAFESVRLDPPWKFWGERDVRTLVEMGQAIGINAKHTTYLEGIAHNALHDARFQALYCSIIWRAIVGKREEIL